MVTDGDQWDTSISDEPFGWLDCERCGHETVGPPYPDVCPRCGLHFAELDTLRKAQDWSEEDR